MTRIDPLVVIERMAERHRSQGAAHPVAGAIALAARGHTRMRQSTFAECAGLPIDVVQSSESGAISFGQLH